MTARSHPTNTPVECRYCGFETTEAMAKHVRENDRCTKSPNDEHAFERR